jgi:Flp pilus assembly protein CpaB
MTLTDFGPASGVTATLARGERAVEVPVQGAPGLVGNLAAGQRVDLYVDLSNGGNGGGANLVRLLATNILVLQPATNGGGVGSTNNGGNLTLALANNLVPAIMYASDNGKLWLALRPGNASNPKRGESATLGSILTGK